MQDPNEFNPAAALRSAIENALSFDFDSEYSPHQPYGRQKLFLDDLRNEKEVFYGGAAGGMKSDALLQAALEYVDVPGYAAILFRRTYKDLSKPEALMSRAHDWLDEHVRAKRIRWNGEAHQFRWADTGAVLAFGHMESENDKLEHQSAAYQFIGFDELTQFSETQYTYLFSRLRRPQVPCARCRLPVTQEDGRWDHAIDPDTGSIPLLACETAQPDQNVLRQYRPSRRGKRIWDIPLRMRSGSNPAEDYRGLWVAERFVPDDFTPEQAEEPRVFWKEGTDVKGRTVKRAFVPSRLEDNPFLDRAEYENSLIELGQVTYKQLRKGDWRIRAKGNILTEWDEMRHVITWSQFKAVYGTDYIPSHWECGISQDWGTTQTHPCVTTLFATAAANSALPGKVFIPWALTLFNARTAQQVATEYLIPQLTALRLYGSIKRWWMSHEASSERNGYNELKIPFVAWGLDACGGLDRFKQYLEIRDRNHVSPFGQTDALGEPFMGCPSLMFVVDDNQLINPRDDKGLARHRAEAAGYSWHVPKAGDPPEKLRPQKLFQDAMDTIRCFAEKQFPKIKPLTDAERVQSEMQPRYRPQAIAAAPPEQQADLEYAAYFAHHEAKKELESKQGKPGYKPLNRRFKGRRIF